MSSQSNFLQPPRFAAWLIALFTTPGREAEFIQGDLQEEFLHLVSQSSIVSARRWYWRQAVKTAAHLIGVGFRTAPWTITAAVVGGFLLRWFVSWWSNPVIRGAIETVLEKYRVYEGGPQVYIFWLTHSMLVEHLIINLLIGGVVAVAAKGREMTAAITLGLVSDLLAVQAAFLTLARTGDHGILWTLPWSFAFSIALIVGGLVVRIRRAAATTQPSTT